MAEEAAEFIERLRNERGHLLHRVSAADEWAEMEREAKAALHGDPLPEYEELIAVARPLTYFEDFDKSVRLDWIIKNVLAKGHTSYFFGPPGSGKSALYGSAAICLGAAPDWYGFKIKQKAASVYFAFERPDLVKKRLWAQCQRDQIDGSLVAVAPGLINLMDQKCVHEIIGTILTAEDKLGIEVGLGIFDTFSKGIAAGRGDENQAKDQNQVWGNLRRVHEGLARYHAIHLGAIGHTGKDESRGPRGSNAADGDNDVSLQIRNEGGIKNVEIYKANELPEGPLMRFKMEPFNTGLQDEDGDPIEVWIVASERITAQPTARTTKPTKNQQTMFALLHSAGSAGLSTDEWNDRARAEGIGVSRRADLCDIRIALKSRKMVREYAGRWTVDHES